MPGYFHKEFNIFLDGVCVFGREAIDEYLDLKQRLHEYVAEHWIDNGEEWVLFPCSEPVEFHHAPTGEFFLRIFEPNDREYMRMEQFANAPFFLERGGILDEYKPHRTVDNTWIDYETAEDRECMANPILGGSVDHYKGFADIRYSKEIIFSLTASSLAQQDTARETE